MVEEKGSQKGGTSPATVTADADGVRVAGAARPEVVEVTGSADGNSSEKSERSQPVTAPLTAGSCREQTEFSILKSKID